MSEPYLIPAQTTTIETEVARSRFIATIYNVDSVESARSTLSIHRQLKSDASHHVYAFRVGHGSTTTEGLSDDGEPSGTSGPPVMAVLRGSDLGDTMIVVTRYFGGTLLGTGGLVRAYTEAASLVIKACPTTEKIDYAIVRVLIEYPVFTVLKRMLQEYDAEITDEAFTDSIELALTLPARNADRFSSALTELTAGSAYIEIVG